MFSKYKRGGYIIKKITKDPIMVIMMGINIFKFNRVVIFGCDSMWPGPGMFFPEFFELFFTTTETASDNTCTHR